MIDLTKPRLTVKHKDKYGLIAVKDTEQDVESPYPNTLKAIIDGLYKLGEFEDAVESGELAPVVRGRWKVDECDSLDDVPSYSWIEFHCSKCNMDYGLEEGEYSWCRGERIPYNYCPNCGAKMDLEEDR